MACSSVQQGCMAQASTQSPAEPHAMQAHLQMTRSGMKRSACRRWAQHVNTGWDESETASQQGRTRETKLWSLCNLWQGPAERRAVANPAADPTTKASRDPTTLHVSAHKVDSLCNSSSICAKGTPCHCCASAKRVHVCYCWLWNNGFADCMRTAETWLSHIYVRQQYISVPLRLDLHESDAYESPGSQH